MEPKEKNALEEPGEPTVSARPSWLKVKVPLGTRYSEIKKLITSQCLHTVCEEARCPNVSECWNRGTATFMILGDICTRDCRFCAVTSGKPAPPDLAEPRRIAESVKIMKLRYAVVTSVTRDDLPDGGASAFANTIRAIREQVPGCRVEVLIPDFRGDETALATVLDARPDILNHNIETVPELYPDVRPQADYRRSLRVLEFSKRRGLTTKSGLMLGLGETGTAVRTVMHDLREIGTDILTLGQYLQPTKTHRPVHRYLTPEEFLEFKSYGLSIGFKHVESAPLVRSSYHADEQTL